MQEQAELGPPSVAVKTAVTSSSVLALISVVCEILTRYRVDPSGGIVAVIRPTDGNIDAASDRPSVEDRPIFLSHAKSFDFLWSSQILVVITCISLAGYGRWDFAVALGIHQTLFQRLHLVKKWEPGRRKLWHAAACSGLVLGLLIVSVFLAERGREPKAAGDFWMPDRAGKYLPLSVVTLVHVWSVWECIATLYRLTRQRAEMARGGAAAQDHAQQRGLRAAILLFSCILTLSILSLGGWAALLVDDYKDFLALVYFTCVPEELVYFSGALWKCRVRWRRGRRQNNLHLSSYPEIQGDINLACAGADSTVALVNESLLVASSLHRKCGVGPDGSGAGSEPAE